jgi:hypothetical protein
MVDDATVRERAHSRGCASGPHIEIHVLSGCLILRVCGSSLRGPLYMSIPATLHSAPSHPARRD